MIKSNRWLRRQFLTLNKAAFKKKLPTDTVVKFGKISALGLTSHTRHSCPTCQGPVHRFVITISDRIRFSGSLSMQTLVHEMVHVERWEWRHSKKFYNRVYEVCAAIKGWL